MLRLLAALLLVPVPAAAHFGLILPEQPMVSQEDGSSVEVTLGFVHPFEHDTLALETPTSVTVTANGETVDLADGLTPVPLLNGEGFTLSVPLSRPGAYIVGMAPQPYWEPAEDVFIVHYTKTVISAFDGDEGWDAMVGYPTEIRPLTRPVGLWEGNVFQGQVMRDGAPLPGAEVEIEYWNTDGRAAPSEIMITQTILADDQGVFSYAPPGPGWWGFAALSTADEPMLLDGVEKDVEEGAVIWVHFEPWP